MVGEGKDQRNMKESFGPAPMLTAFLKSDLNIGTLIVSPVRTDVRVFVNEKEYRRKTQRGQVRIPAIGKVNGARRQGRIPAGAGADGRSQEGRRSPARIQDEAAAAGEHAADSRQRHREPKFRSTAAASALLNGDGTFA